MSTYIRLKVETPPGQEEHHVKMWTRHVPVEEEAMDQLRMTASLPIVFRHVAAMPDVHVGRGATVGSVVPTRKAIIPAAVGVDIGCGMCAIRTSLTASDLPENLKRIREAIERAVPHGRTVGRKGGTRHDKGSWGTPPDSVLSEWRKLDEGFKVIAEKQRSLRKANTVQHLGTLGTGNHFIEVCLDEAQQVWIMLHSGSRGIGNAIGSLYIELAKKDMEKRHDRRLPHKDLSYLEEGTDHFDDYWEAVSWAQDFAARNRKLMLDAVLRVLRDDPALPPFQMDKKAINCHHNYVALENHYGEDVYVTRKGAIRAREGDLGIIPGSMGARSFIVRGKGNPESFSSCSHGAGRVYSRTEANRRFSVEDHIRATDGVECRKDASVLDETPAAYKDIDRVMESQQDLVEIVHTLKQVVCVKG